MMTQPARRFDRQGRSSSARTATRNSLLRLETLEAREVPATGLGVANDYSAFILRNLNAFNSDIQGRVAVGGNANITAYAVGDRLADSDGSRDDLIVGGNLNFTNGQVFFGNIVYGGTGTFDQFGHPNGSIRQGTMLDFGAATAELNTLSNSYAALPANGTVRDQFGTIILKGTNAGQNVFNVPASMLWNAYDLIIRTPAGSTAIVNITGTEARMQFMGFHLEGVSKENVILNFPQATTLTFQGIGIFGNVLAPWAHVEFSNGQLNGTLVACSMAGYGQINFVPTAPPPEEPCGCPPLPPSQVSGMVYFDKNKDGQAQDSEPRLQGVAVSLTGADAEGHAVTRSATTNAGGIYSFGDLPAGTYAIQVNTPVGFAAGQSSAGAFGGESHPNVVSGLSIPAGQSSGGYNFAEVELEPPPQVLTLAASEVAAPPTSQLGGLIYVDKNKDGLVQDDEKRLKGVVVVLTGRDYTGKKVTVRTRTDATGAYNFEGLAAGTYTISVRTPALFRAGRSSAGILGGQAKPNKITGITIAAGQIVDGYTFGQVRNAPAAQWTSR